MTTDDVKKTVNEFQVKRKRWPSYAELADALLAKGFIVDDTVMNELLSMLFESNELHLNNGAIEV